jgi:predicted peptidase
MSQPGEVHFLPRQVTIDAQRYPYAIYVPTDYSDERKWPAIVFLNGAGERGADGMLQTRVGIGPAIVTHPKRFGCIVVMPQSQPGMLWQDPAMVALVMACVEAAEAEFNIDAKRIALTGLSLGGFGTWHIGALHPDRFCALGPICGGGDPEQARKLARTPIWAFHGEADPVVPADRTREMVAAVRLAGGDVRYTELPGVGHNSWDAAYGDRQFIEWLLERR